MGAPRRKPWAFTEMAWLTKSKHRPVKNAFMVLRLLFENKTKNDTTQTIDIESYAQQKTKVGPRRQSKTPTMGGRFASFLQLINAVEAAFAWGWDCLAKRSGLPPGLCRAVCDWG